MRSARDARDAGRESRHVTSAVHPGRSCEECVLCKKKDLSKFSHPKSWKDPSLLQQLQAAEPSLNVQPESCICLLCRRDVSNVNDVSFSPRWRKNTGIMKLICYIPNCTNTDIKTKLIDVQQLTPFFPVGHNDATFSNEDGTNNVPICSYHYMQWYRYAHTTHSDCKTCGKQIRDYSKSRPVPEPVVLQHFLNTNTEFKGTFQPDDRVCYACYKSHLIAVKHAKNVVTSTDGDLTDLISEIKQNLPRLSDVRTWENVIDYAVHSLAITVGEGLLKQTAFLLPQVYSKFKLELDSIATKSDVQKEDKNLHSHTWLRSCLSSLLQHHMAYRCAIPKYGTLIYRYGGDLVHALTVALEQGNTQVATTFLFSMD